MNRKEPYIGMPVILGDFDDFDDFDHAKDHLDDQVPCCGKMETRVEQNRAADHPQNMQPMALAMAYVPWQKWTEVYPYDEGLKKGTIFPDLYLPFEGKRKGGMRR